MKVKETPWTAKVGVVLALVAGVFLLPGLVVGERAAFGSVGTSIRVDDDGDRVRAEVRRQGYRAELEAEGAYTLDADESDLATLAPGGEFELSESLGDAHHSISIRADRDGKLTRAYQRDGKPAAFDAGAQRWLAAALPRLMRETGFDAEARAGRLLARGGPSALLAEIELITADHARAAYVGALLGQARLEPAELGRAIALASKLGSDFEKRRALGAALAGQQVDAARTVAILEVAATIGSDFERAELLLEASARIGGDAAVRDAWLAAAAGIGSDFELRRTLERALDQHGKDPALAAGALGLAKAKLHSDFELRSLLERAAHGVGDDRALIDAYLAAAREIDSDFERREALLALLVAGPSDPATLGGVLDAMLGMGSDFERHLVLEKLAPKVAGDAALTKRYRELARGMGDFERGEALKALDDATAL